MERVMSTALKDDGALKPQAIGQKPSIWRWLLYCGGVCLELLGMAFMGAVVVVFFGQVDTRVLLSLTAAGMILFYSGWFCVRQASQRGSTTSDKGGSSDAR
jgi:L-asparagine transporter-like permease